MNQFGDDARAEAWFVARRWPDGIACVYCDSKAVKPRKDSRQTPRYHCGGGKGDFTVKAGAIRHDSRLPLSQWAIAFYLYSTNRQGVSSMKLHRDLGITQKSAWYRGRCIRECWGAVEDKFAGPVEADETYIGGKEGNKHASRKLRAGRGTAGKAAVVGVKDRESNKVNARAVKATDAVTLQGFVLANTADAAVIYTDEAGAYKGLTLQRKHAAVKHSAKEFVRDGVSGKVCLRVDKRRIILLHRQRAITRTRKKDGNMPPPPPPAPELAISAKS